MLRMLSLLVLGSSSLAMAQVPPAQPSPTAPAEASGSGDVALDAAVAPEAPKMRKVCRTFDVVGSSIPRRICTMKPARAPQPSKDS